MLRCQAGQLAIDIPDAYLGTGLEAGWNFHRFWGSKSGFYGFIAGALSTKSSPTTQALLLFFKITNLIIILGCSVLNKCPLKSHVLKVWLYLAHSTTRKWRNLQKLEFVEGGEEGTCSGENTEMLECPSGAVALLAPSVIAYLVTCTKAMAPTL